MKRTLTTALTVIGAVTVLMLAANTVAYAATGGKFILGHTNKAGKQTTLKRTRSGAALGLTTKSSSNAPLTTNGKGRVANLNADMVDGLDSTALKTSAYVFTKAVTVATTDVVQPITLPAGTYLVGYSAYMSGGGTDGGQAGCYIWRKTSAPGTAVGESRIATLSTIVPSVSGNGIVSAGPGVTLELKCFAPAAFTTVTGEPIQITALRTSVVGGGALRSAPSGRITQH